MDETELSRRYRVVLILWAALLGGVLLFAAVAWALTAGVLGQAPSAVLDGTLARFLLGVAVVLMVGGILLRRSTWGGAPSRSPLDAWQQRAVVAWALQEGGGILGVALSLGAGEPVWVLAMGGLAAFTLVRSRPRKAELERVSRS